MDTAAGPRSGAPSRDRLPLEELRGAIRLAASGVIGVTHIAEGLHSRIARLAPPLGQRPERPAPGISGLVYRTVRGTTSLVEHKLDKALCGIQWLLGQRGGRGGMDTMHGLAVKAALNGVMGDHLERTGNPLAMGMHFVEPASRGPQVVLLVHGLCMNDRQWLRGGQDHGRALEAVGWSPVYVRYNSGLHVSTNGATLARRLDELLANWPVPVERLAIVGHSMGGLIARSAVHQAKVAGMAWPGRLHRMAFLGTPHHGAALERAGNRLHKLLEISPYVAPFSRLARLRSDGITDLRHGNLLQEDWEPDTYAQRDTRTAVPLPEGVACHAVAGSLGSSAKDPLLGDGLVTVASALGRHATKSRVLRFPASHRWVARGVGHLGLLESPAVRDKLLEWFEASPPQISGRS